MKKNKLVIISVLILILFLMPPVVGSVETTINKTVNTNNISFDIVYDHIGAPEETIRMEIDYGNFNR